MRPKRLAVVMPAYNEAQAIGSFIQEIAVSLADYADEVVVVVVDDRSTDGTAEVLRRLPVPGVELVVQVSEVNLGHGPTAIAAYLRGLSEAADVIIHVDGDGQFLGKDFPSLLQALDGSDVVHGVRRHRADPWYRRAVTLAVLGVVSLWTHSWIPDVNTPLRAYRRDALSVLLEAVPARAAVPHVHFSLLESQLRMRVRHVAVESIPRRGDSTAGTMWTAGRRPPLLPPPRLRRFLGQAAAEIMKYRVRRAPIESPALTRTGSR